jgi:RNA polymerase sigma-70 factor (ECF subfamily)
VVLSSSAGDPVPVIALAPVTESVDAERRECMAHDPARDLRTEAGFVAAYREHGVDLVAYFYRRTLSAEAAADLTAETFAKAWLLRRRYRPSRGTPGAWLQHLASQELLHFWRHARVSARARSKLGLPELVYEPDELGDIERRCDMTTALEALDSSIAVLPRAQAEALRLRIVEQLPYEEIALRLGCTQGAARVRVTRALRTLRGLAVGSVVP